MDYTDAVQKAILFIHQKYNEPITVADISAHVYFSPSYFSTVFRTLTGFTVKDYLLRYRLYMTARALRDTQKHMFTIAFENGFTTQQAFTKSFTQMYEISPARFRQTKPRISKFPPRNLLTRKDSAMELHKIFENVRYMKKDAFFVAGIETDIHYNSPDGTSSIGGLYGRWFGEKCMEHIPNQIHDNVQYGITHESTIYDTAKYMIAVEVSTLDNLPPGYIGRKFEAFEYAVFDCTLDDVTSGKFWNYFYKTFLKEHNLSQPGILTTMRGYTLTYSPNIEVYGKTFQIYAPIIRNEG
jgi:AraC family transcriptional regulator